MSTKPDEDLSATQQRAQASEQPSLVSATIRMPPAGGAPSAGSGGAGPGSNPGACAADEAKVPHAAADTIRRMQRLAGERREIEACHEEAIKEAQRVCPHPDVLESGYRRGILFDHLPVRVCQSCGLVEEGWTFKILPKAQFTVPRDQIYRASRHASHGSPK